MATLKGDRIYFVNLSDYLSFIEDIASYGLTSLDFGAFRSLGQEGYSIHIHRDEVFVLMRMILENNS